MSKGNTFELELGAELPQLSFGSLPLVVIGTVAWGATRLILAAHVESEILLAVILLVAVLVVDKFVTGKWTTKEFGHNPAVLKHRASTAFHLDVPFEVSVADGILSETYVSSAIDSPPRRIAFSSEIACQRLSVPTWSTGSTETRVGHQVPEMSPCIPPLDFTERAGHRRGGPHVAINLPRLHSGESDSWMTGHWLGILRHNHGQQVVSRASV